MSTDPTIATMRASLRRSDRMKLSVAIALWMVPLALCLAAWL